MAVFRIERTKDYTVMSNHHLRNHELSLKAKGLLSMMLSLPDDWNYTTRGLAKICKEGVDAIGSALRELETAGYIVRNQLRDQQGRISDTEYVIYEKPQPRQPETPRPDTAVPDTASPDTENPYLDKPDTEKPAELNIEKPNTQKQNTHGASTDSIPFRETAAAQLPERKGRDAMSVSEIENYRELILENIEYDYLCREFSTYREDLDEIVELMVETVCAKRKTTRIAGSDFPHEVVRSRFLKLDSEHIRFVMDGMQKNTTEVRNMKQYLLAVLFNAPTTISNHYTVQVNHDMNTGGWKTAAFLLPGNTGRKDFAMKRPLAYITAPWSNNQYENAENAAPYCRQVYDAGYSPICPVLFLSTFLKDEIPQEHKDGLDMVRDYLRRSHVLVVCGHGIDETVKNDIATAERLRITATTLDGILTVKGQGRGKGGARHA